MGVGQVGTGVEWLGEGGMLRRGHDAGWWWRISAARMVVQEGLSISIEAWSDGKRWITCRWLPYPSCHGD